MAEEQEEEEEDENKRIRPWERAHGQKIDLVGECQNVSIAASTPRFHENSQHL